MAKSEPFQLPAPFLGPKPHQMKVYSNFTPSGKSLTLIGAVSIAHIDNDHKRARSKENMHKERPLLLNCWVKFPGYL